MLERGITGLLPAFFSQSMIGDPLNGYARASWVAQIQMPGETFRIRATVPLDEEESNAMELAMTELRVTDPTAYRVLELHWGHGWSDGKIGRNFAPRMARKEVEQIRLGAQNRVESRIGGGNG